MTLAFEKYQGLGNDFIFIDRSQLQVPFFSEEIQKLCNRHEGIGADGLIIVNITSTPQIEIYNADGSLAEMCGNALRCLFLFLKKRMPDKEVFEVQSMQKTHQLSLTGEEIECTLGCVDSIEWDILLDLDAYSFKGHFLNTGVPHLVIPVNDLHHIPILPLGSALRHHPRFQPQGTNVNFICLSPEKRVEIRTYERGVENETKACGTGCAAAAIIAKMLFNLQGPVAVRTSYGEPLHFDFQLNSENNQVSSLVMRGKAQFVFEGAINFTNFRKNVVLSARNP